ncbi:hypothetical protein [Falsirhodobacter halotolerans]|uniref:hypothetical protein n=1 Tax=Falsirhodobacter halotolerans TaxID=1146892 RepID=UPI001FD240BE|nr:hypothetical protein [Falsirhodobacter halotolerans]MCJ8139269.1 hypothetical protein [Falsirhodobacter halotolerans]
MIDWVLDHSPFLMFCATAITSVVWIIYLQVFLRSYLRQRRSMILITAAGGRGMESHCIVTQLGLEPISILSVILDVADDTTSLRAVIPERNELMVDEGNEQTLATNQGPMAVGTMRDIGRFSTLLKRATDDNPEISEMGEIVRITVTIVAATSAGPTLTGAARSFAKVVEQSGRTRMRGMTVETRQLHTRKDRRALLGILTQDLQDNRVPTTRA